MTTSLPPASPVPTGATRILRTPEDSPEELLGFVDVDGVIFRLRWGEPRAQGRAEERGGAHHILRSTTHGERELGFTLPTGAVHSARLLEGGPLGWLEPDGVVIQGGLILGEQEVGRVEGPRALAAAAALLLIFLPDEAEASRRAAR